MSYSNLLDLNVFFSKLVSLEYAVVKFSSDFPNYYSGSDIDLFCGDIDAVARVILSAGASSVHTGRYFKVTRHQYQCYVDYYNGDQIDFRFDLYGALPHYTRLCLKPWLIYSVLDLRVGRTIDNKNNRYVLFTACEQHELLLRYVEYIEWFDRREDKIKHLQFVLERIDDDERRRKFIELLHRYIEVPAARGSHNAEENGRFGRISKLLKFYYARVREKGLKRSMRALARRFREREQETS